MDRQHWKKISHIFDLALTLPQDRRTTYIKQLCAGDPELEQEISDLLTSIEASDQMLDDHLQKNEALLSNLTTHLRETDTENSLVGQTIDSWKVTALLGRGGMGEVYTAQRINSDIHQKGALKIMRRGLNTPENIKRFRLEKQILAGLHHPNIAGLIEGGLSENGLPYLVMEYVDGAPIDQYCDKHKLSIHDRLQLFKTVCQTVQYAHKNLIVHRDLKPDNILVTREGRVKILDFGIAKLLDPDLFEFSSVETRQGMRLMSLDYAAPEQVSGGTISTSTDLYALGTLLYELLAGVLPFDFEDKKYQSIIETIQTEHPPSPSKRLRQQSGSTAVAKTAAARSMKSDELTNKLSGDLDAIVLKTLRKEPEERYNSIDQLENDISSYLNHQPVQARGTSLGYRSRKFFSRHKKGTRIAASFLAILISLVSYYTYRLAEERNSARLEAQKAEQVKDLLIDTFQSGNPFLEPNTKNLSIQQVLDQGSQQLTNELSSQPLMKAELQEALGQVYAGLIMYSEAEPLLWQALSAFKDNLNSNHPDIARVSHELGFLLLRKGAYEEANILFNDAKQIYQNLYGKQDPNYAYALKMLANLHDETGQPQKALEEYQRAITIYEKNADPRIAGASQDLGYLLMGIGQFDKAQKSLERSIALYRKHYEEPEVAVADALTGLGQTMQLSGKLDKAEEFHRQALSIRQGIFNQDHTYIASSYLRLGWVLVEQQRIAEAVPMVKKAYQSFKKHLPPNHWKIAASEGVLALAWIGQGKFKQAEKTLLNTYTVFKKQFGSNDWRTQKARQTVAKLYAAWKKPQKAQAYLNN